VLVGVAVGLEAEDEACADVLLESEDEDDDVLVDVALAC
jgi:hypothetical protein